LLLAFHSAKVPDSNKTGINIYFSPVCLVVNPGFLLGSSMPRKRAAQICAHWEADWFS
jgi:hypothetical protein